jgi:fumarate reductase subunit D
VPRSREPYLWAVFSAGGMAAAMVLPAVAFVLWVAGPAGWVDVGYDALAATFRHPVTRIVLFGLVTGSLFHAAHRFRYTLYDGLQLYHLNALIAVLTYGLATALSALAAVVAFAL